jgi:hypothetical protein
MEQAAPQTPPQPELQPLPLHHFSASVYDEVVKVVVENNTCILQEIQKGNVITEALLGNILRAFVSQCLRRGMPAGDKLTDANLTCRHIFKKGAPEKVGRECGSKANFVGVEGLPKCSTHKTSKATGVASAVTSAASTSGATFSYKNHANTGKVASQNLTSIQASIAQQNTPANITLIYDNELNIHYTAKSNLVFEKRGEGITEKWVVVGVRSDEGVEKLTTFETFLCDSNGWKWDPLRVNDDPAVNESHPLASISSNHHIVSNDSAVLAEKFERMNQNSEFSGGDGVEKPPQ